MNNIHYYLAIQFNEPCWIAAMRDFIVPSLNEYLSAFYWENKEDIVSFINADPNNFYECLRAFIKAHLDFSYQIKFGMKNPYSYEEEVADIKINLITEDQIITQDDLKSRNALVYIKLFDFYDSKNRFDIIYKN